jgi:hypothetical protein
MAKISTNVANIADKGSPKRGNANGANGVL